MCTIVNGFVNLSLSLFFFSISLSLPDVRTAFPARTTNIYRSRCLLHFSFFASYVRPTRRICISAAHLSLSLSLSLSHSLSLSLSLLSRYTVPIETRTPQSEDNPNRRDLFNACSKDGKRKCRLAAVSDSSSEAISERRREGRERGR
jgi:hypothetical protein